MADRTRVVSANDLHVLMTMFIDAAQSIHIAMCRFSDDHAAQEYLNKAIHSALSGAEQCRQLHGSQKFRLATETQPESE
jgi:imidazoleglycerol phosphate dehydratase HisB